MTNKTKQYLKENFDSKLYMNQHYIKDEKAIIPIYITNIDDIYISYDEQKQVLRSELISYIEDIAYYVPYDISIVLEFSGYSFKEEEKVRLMENITNQFGMKTHDMEVELNYNAKKAIKLFVVGSIVLAISFMIRTLQYTNYVSEILSIIGTFSIWEFVNTIWFERKEKRVNKLNAGQLSVCTVTFQEEEKNESEIKN